MRKVLGVTLEIAGRMQHTVIVEEHPETGVRLETVLVEKPLTLENDDRGHEMVLNR